MKEPTPPNYDHDPDLGHVFHATSTTTDRCDLCRAWVSRQSSGLGAGGRHDEPCWFADPSTAKPGA